MAIQDSDPERRNLMVTSIAFIAFYYAGGSFPDSTIRLQVINAHFSRPNVLGFIAWLSFLWFIYRYWLTHNGNFSTMFKREFTRCSGKKFIINYISKRIDQTALSDKDEGYHVNAIVWQNGRVVARLQYALNVHRDQEGVINGWSGTSPSEKKNIDISFSDFRGWYVAIRATLECFVKEQSFTSYIFPYLLAILAFVGPLVN